MTRLWLRLPLVGFVSALAACGDGLNVGTADNTAEQAIARTIVLSAASLTIDEGSTASVDVTQLCVDVNNQLVTIRAEFNDPNSGADIVTRTVDPTALAGGVFPAGTCGVGRFAVCDTSLGVANPAVCNDFDHVFADNVSVVARVLSFQAPATAEEASQTLPITVNNVAPDVDLQRLAAVGQAEGVDQLLTGSVTDPGGLATEISSVTWTFAAAANVDDPTTVACTCQPTVTCLDQAGATIAAVEGTEALCGNNTSNTRTRTFLEGPAAIVTTLTIVDKDGGSDVVDLTVNTVNETPQINSLAVTLPTAPVGGFSAVLQNNTSVSTLVGARTQLSEGFTYRYDATISESGIDALDINWDVLVGAAGGESAGTAEVTKASHPTIINFAPAAVLSPSFTYNDDDGAVPNNTDRDINLNVNDDDGGGANADRFVTIVDVNPIITSFASNVLTTAEAGSITWTVAAQSGARDNPAFDPLNTSGFTWTLDGRDITVNGNLAGVYSITGCTSSSLTCTVQFLDDDPPTGQDASWTMAVTARDEDSSTTQAATAITVTNVNPTITAFDIGAAGDGDQIDEAQSASATFTFADPAGALDGPFVATINFGGEAGAPAVGLRTASPAPTAPGTVTLASAAAYRDNDDCQNKVGPVATAAFGECTVTYAVCETGGLRCATPDDETLRVNNVNPTATFNSPTAGQTIEEGVAFSLDGSMDDVAGALDLNYTATWVVEGRTTTSTISNFAQRDTQIDATETYAEDIASTTITLDLVDEDTGAITQISRNVIVDDNDPNINTPTVSLGNSGNEPTGSASITLTVSAETASDLLTNVTVNWGDGTTERYTTGINGVGTAGVTPTLVKGSGDVCVTGACVAGYDDGRRLNGAALPYVITATVNDEDSSVTAPTVNANVVDLDPALANGNIVPDVNTPIVIAEGTAAAFVIRTTDASASDRGGLRLTPVVNLNARGLFAEIDFGDGSPVELIDGSTQGLDTIIRTAHVYTDIGQFPVRIRTFDQDANIVGGVLQPALPANPATQLDNANDGVSAIIFATVEVVNLAPILTDVFTSQPILEGVDMSAVALVNNRGLDPLAFSFIFDCNPLTFDDAGIEAAFDAVRVGGAADIEGSASAVGHFTYANDDNLVVCVEVCDDDNAANSCDFGFAPAEILNQAAELVVTVADATINEGQTASISATGLDLGDDLFTYTIDCTDDGTFDTILVEDDDIAIGDPAVFSCTYGDNGVFTARVVVDDGVTQTERTAAITVANLAPVGGAAAAAAVAEGVASTLTFAGATDVAADVLRVEYDIDGDNAADLFSSTVAGNFPVSFRLANPTGASTSNTFRARACDDDNGCGAFVTGTAVVNNAAPSIVVVNVPATVGLASPIAVSAVAADAGNDTLSYAFAFTGPETFNVAAQASSVASASFNTTGNYTVTVTVSDGVATATQAANFVVVEGPNEAPRITSFTTSNASPNEGGTAVLTATAVDNGADPLTFSFNCGNGTTSPTSATASFTCTYAQSGNFVASVTVTDTAGATANQALAIRALNVAPALVSTTAAAVTEGASSILTVAGTSDVAGDIIRIEYDINGDGAFDLFSNNANGAVSFAFANPTGAATTSNYVARACDNEGACSATVAGTATVNNAAPVVAAVNVPGTVGIAAPVAVSAIATDAGDDALSFTFVFDGPGTAEDATVTSTSSVVSRAFNTVGTFTVSVTANDGVVNSAASTATFAVIEGPNEAPRITTFTTTNGTPNEGGSVTLAATATDNGNDPLTFAFDCGNGTNSGAASATASFACTYAQSGNFVASVVVADNTGASVTQSLALRVVNVAPVLTATAAAAVAEGAASILTVTPATDVAGDVVRIEYDVDGDGAFDLFSNASNGSASFRFANAAGASTSNAYVARACDNEGACSATVAGTAVVNNAAPTIAVVNVPAQVGISAPLAVSAVALDAGNDALQYTFAFTGPETLTVGPQASSVASASFVATGSYVVTVTVSDGVATATQAANFAVVEGPNEAPRVLTFTVDNAAPNEGGVANLTATAFDNGGDALTFAFDCGNGTNSGAASATATFACTFAQSGNFIASVLVTDTEGATATQSLAIRAVNVAPVAGVFAAAEANEGSSSTLTLTGSTDVAGDTVRIEYDTNGDGAFDVVSVAADGSAVVRFADGDSAVSARACDNEGACSAPVAGVASVSNVAPVIATVQSPATALVGSPVTVNVNASDVGGDALTYTFTFTGAGDVVTVGPQASPSATVTFNEAASYTVSVAVTDTANAPQLPATATQSATFIVRDINVNLIGAVSYAAPNANGVANEGGAATVTVTSTNGVGPFLVSYDFNADGDFNDAGVDVLNQACANDPCSASFTFPQNRAGDISYRVLVSVTDQGNNDTVETAIVAVDVQNVAPTFDAGADASVVELATFARALTATDPGVAAAVPGFPAPDTLTFSLVSGPAGLTVSATGQVSWTPSFSDEGTHAVNVRVADSDGAAVNDTFNVTVTIIDANNNGISDTRERAINGGELLDPDAEDTDSDDDGVSDLDEVLAGTDPDVSDAPKAPVVISPNNVTVDTLTPTLTVANAVSPRGLALTYVFVIEDSAGVEVARIEDVAEGEATTSALVPAGELSEQATFTWFAFAKDGLTTLDGLADIEGEVSDTGTFTVDAENATPPSPDALTPANDSEFLEGTFVTLEARAVVDADGDAVSYTFELASDAAFATIVETSPARDVPVFTLPEALAVGSYFWRATASDGEATSAPGAAGNFDIVAIEINDPPGAPTITSPNNETLAATSATLTIGAATDPDGDVLEYEFELADNAAFANAEASGAQAGLTFDVDGLSEDTTHFWRARAFDGSLYSDWVNATFVVDAANGAPTGLALLSPSDGALLLEAPAAFTATEAVDPEGDALTYQVVVSASDDFASPILDAAAVVEEGVVRLAAPESLAGDLEAGKTYFWRVTATDGTNDIVAAASFSLFKPQDIPAPAGGGCGCDQSQDNGVAGVAVALLALVGLRRRRR